MGLTTAEKGPRVKCLERRPVLLSPSIFGVIGAVQVGNLTIELGVLSYRRVDYDETRCQSRMKDTYYLPFNYFTDYGLFFKCASLRHSINTLFVFFEAW